MLFYSPEKSCNKGTNLVPRAARLVNGQSGWWGPALVLRRFVASQLPAKWDFFRHSGGNSENDDLNKAPNSGYCRARIGRFLCQGYPRRPDNPKVARLQGEEPVSLESNKVFAAVLSSALLIMVITTVSEGIFHTEHAKPAYTIEVAEEASTEAVVEEGPSLAELMAAADPAKGERQWAKCRACHTLEKGGRNGTGPNLYGVVGRGVGDIEGFNYSGALAGNDAVWTWELLNHWLQSPKNTFPGTSMAFAGIRKEGQRADLLAYLNTFSDAPLDLPEETAAAEE
jgi:cytochrome c